MRLRETQPFRVCRACGMAERILRTAPGPGGWMGGGGIRWHGAIRRARCPGQRRCGCRWPRGRGLTRTGWAWRPRVGAYPSGRATRQGEPGYSWLREQDWGFVQGRRRKSTHTPIVHSGAAPLLQPLLASPSGVGVPGAPRAALAGGMLDALPGPLRGIAPKIVTRWAWGRSMLRRHGGASWRRVLVPPRHLAVRAGAVDGVRLDQDVEAQQTSQAHAQGVQGSGLG